MKSRIVSALILGLSAAAAAGGLDAYGTRQTAGIFVTVNGSVRTIYLDFEAREAGEADGTEIPLTLTSDVDLWLGEYRVPAGRHEWTFRRESAKAWTIGEAAGGRRGEEEAPKRFPLEVEAGARPSRWLAAFFELDPEGEGVLACFRAGDREGWARFTLEEGAVAPVSAAPTIGVPELRSLRDRLLNLAGDMEAARRRRHAWSTIFAEIGDVLARGRGWVTGMSLIREADHVAFTIRGRCPGDRSVVDELGASLARGELARLFGRVGKPIPRVLPGDRGWSFEISAESDRERFEPVTPVTALAEGDRAAGLAEEILLLEERLGRSGKMRVESLTEARSLLLAAKRDSGALLSKIEPGQTILGDHGHTRFDLRLTVSGAGRSLVRFLRALEDSDSALRIVPVSLTQGEFSPELDLEVTFLGYRSLSDRNPRLLATIRTLGLGEEFDENLKIYLRGIAETPTLPYREPDWRQDPFAAPLDD